MSRITKHPYSLPYRSKPIAAATHQYQAQKQNTAVIIGGGIAGVNTALELVEYDHKLNVVIYECQKELLQATSNATPCRASLGAHYPDSATGIQLLEATCELVLHYSDLGGFLVGTDKPRNHPIRSCDYVVAVDSTEPPEQVEKILKCLQERYTEIAKRDPNIIKFFGNPDEFWVKLSEDQYPEGLCRKSTAAVYRIPEHLLDWPRYQKFLIKKIGSHPRITVYKNTKVEKITKLFADTPMGYQYQIRAINSQGQKSTHAYDFLVNASWANTSQLDSPLIAHEEKCPQTMRLKAMVEISNIPKVLKNIPHQFRCFGGEAGTAINFRPNGHAFLTCEKFTNLWQGSALTEEPKRYLAKQANEDEIKKIAEKILQGASERGYPSIKDSSIETVRFGIVITDGETVDINQKQGGHTERRFTGVTYFSISHITNQARKHMFGRMNAKKIVELYKIYQVFNQCLIDISREMGITTHHTAVISQLYSLILPKYQRLGGLPELIIDTNDLLKNYYKIFKYLRSGILPSPSKSPISPSESIRQVHSSTIFSPGRPRRRSQTEDQKMMRWVAKGSQTEINNMR